MVLVVGVVEDVECGVGVGFPAECGECDVVGLGVGGEEVECGEVLPDCLVLAGGGFLAVEVGVAVFGGVFFVWCFVLVCVWVVVECLCAVGVEGVVVVWAGVSVEWGCEEEYLLWVAVFLDVFEEFLDVVPDVLSGCCDVVGGVSGVVLVDVGPAVVVGECCCCCD